MKEPLFKVGDRVLNKEFQTADVIVEHKLLEAITVLGVEYADSRVHMPQRHCYRVQNGFGRLSSFSLFSEESMEAVNLLAFDSESGTLKLVETGEEVNLRGLEKS